MQTKSSLAMRAHQSAVERELLFDLAACQHGIERPARERFRQAGSERPDADIDAGGLALHDGEQIGDAGQQRVVDGRDGKAAPRVTRIEDEVACDCATQLRQAEPDHRRELERERGRDQTVGAAHHEVVAVESAQPAQRMAHRRLAHCEQPGGTGDAALRDQGIEDHEQTEGRFRDIRFIHAYMIIINFLYVERWGHCGHGKPAEGDRS